MFNVLLIIIKYHLKCNICHIERFDFELLYMKLINQNE